ncbi:circadian locomoter output cycles protein kaput-like isoform X1 [Rhipicephalus microplus]|uniref:circadian locomoter output cycles protein kaput-like isoform X1 n=1 Tax=Rhipicephalus microplus TaxID=6941 RepID=UPI003F6C25BD
MVRSHLLLCFKKNNTTFCSNNIRDIICAFLSRKSRGYLTSHAILNVSSKHKCVADSTTIESLLRGRTLCRLRGGLVGQRMRATWMRKTKRRGEYDTNGRADMSNASPVGGPLLVRRKSRNLSEKKRRDQFNMLINELCSMVSTSSRKMDKSTVLRATIAFLRAHNDVSIQNQEQESQENWKPSFLSNEEFTHLMLESLEGFLLVLSLSGQILYTSESVASLLGYLPHELHNIFILDILHESDHGTMCEVLSSASSQGAGIIRQDGTHETFVSVDLYMKRGSLGSTDSNVRYEPMNLKGTFLTAVGEGFPLGGLEYDSNSCSSACSPNTGSAELAAPCLVAMVRLQTPQLMHELILCDGSRNEFSSRHSLEWKFLFLDHRAPPIIGYLPFEVLGTSGYDYYHVEDLEKVAAGQEALMQTGEGTSCHYRFLTKGQQWIWLQTRYYITYHQWSSKPEFVVCTHTVMSYDEDLTHSKATPSSGVPAASYSRTSAPTRMSYQSSRVSSAPSVSSRDSLSPNLSEKSGCAGGVLREEHGSSARSCGNQLSLPFTEACTITRESPTMGRLASLASEPTSSASSQLQHEPMDQRPPYQTTTACHAPLITLTTLQPIAATFTGSAQGGMAAGAAVQASERTTASDSSALLLACKQHFGLNWLRKIRI